MVGPGTTYGAEHIASEDERAKVFHSPRSKYIVDVPNRSTLLPDHGTEGPRVKEPLKEIRSSLSERIGQALFGPRAETVQRDPKSGDSHSRHLCSFLKFLVATSSR